MYTAKVISVEQSRQLEQAADAAGVSYATMMENAGRGVAREIGRRMALTGARIVLLIGPGNNGGDGLVAAHYLAAMGASVTCYLWKRGRDGDPNLKRVLEGGLPVLQAEGDQENSALRQLLAEADVVVDALLGVGVDRPISGTLEALLGVARAAMTDRRSASGLQPAVPADPGRSRPLIVAVDCPSGLDNDTGALDPAALAADVTVTFAHPKAGLLRFPGAQAVGEIVVADIGIDPDLAEEVPLVMVMPGLVAGWLPERRRSAHKGTHGSALLVAGSANYVGAATLSGAAATRVGTGLVTLGLPLPIQPAVAASLHEATYLLLPHDMGVVASGAVDVLREHMGEYDALLVGPGLSREKATVAFVHKLLGLELREGKGRLGFVGSAPDRSAEQPSLPPLVVDADGLNALARAEAWWTVLPRDTILTPHPGEMARLIGGEATAADVQADREAICQLRAEEWDAVVVLKGAFTVVAAPDGRVAVLPFANAGLATAGTGDVLAGTIVGLRAQGLAAFEAAVAGAYLHGLAGELARGDLGEMGMVAGDLPPRLPLAIRRVRNGAQT